MTMDYREQIVHGNEGLPVALYHIDHTHIRYRMTAHWHPEHEIVFVERGRLRLTLNSTVLEVGAGSVVFITGGMIHSAEPTDCVYHCFLVNLPLLMKKSDACMAFAERLRDGTVSVSPLLEDSPARFAPICREIIRLDLARGDGFPFLLKGAIFSFFGNLLDGGFCTDRAEGTADAAAGRMKHVMTYMEEHYTADLRLSTLASLADMTPNYFCHCFRQTVGQSPMEYLIRYRLAQAQYALRTTEQSITDIALGNGFGDVSYFIRAFRRRYGITPRQYRVRAEEL